MLLFGLGACANLTGKASGTTSQGENPAARQAFARAAELLSQGEREKALTELRRCVETSSRVEYHVRYQDVASGLPERAAERVAMEKFYADFPDDQKSPLAPYLAARLQRLARREEPARLLLQRALQRSPNYYPAQLELGLLWRGVDKPEKAAEWFRKATVSDPTRAEAQLGLAELAVVLTNWKEAARHYKAYLALRPKDEEAQRTYLSLLLYRTGGDVGEMEALVSSLAKSYPADASLRMDRAAVYWRQNKIDAAISEYRAVLRKDPSRFRAALNLGNLFYDRATRHKASPERKTDLGRARRAYRYFRAKAEISDAFDWFDLKLAVKARLAKIAGELGPASADPVRVEDL